MFKYLKEYVDFSVKANEYVSTIMLDYGIGFEDYSYSHVWKLVQSQGVTIREFQFKDIASKRIAGILIQDSLETTIGFNRMLDEKSRNFAISHEIAHYLFHTNDQNLLFVDTLDDMQPSYPKELYEFQANIGASVILIPDSVLFYVLKKGWGISRISDVFGITKEALDFRLILMMQANLGYSFKVAKEHTDEICYAINAKERITTVQLITKLEYQLKSHKEAGI